MRGSERPGGPGVAGGLRLAVALVVGLCGAWWVGPAAAGLIGDVEAVTLRVGERAVIGGVTGPCGRLPDRAALRGAVTACTIDRAPRKNTQPSDHAPVVVTLG